MSWTLFVEGPWDVAFVQWLLQYLGVKNVEVGKIGGGVSSLHKVANEILKSRAEGRRVALLLDADTDVQTTRRELATQVHALNLPVARSFLLPDDVREGALETLLKQLAPPSHEAVYRCFDDYEACLRGLDRNYTTPGAKARIFAYCEAVGAVTGPEKEYRNESHWDPEAPALRPLRGFLQGLVD